MIERLLENWLDSASERSYQGPFLQMLSAAGFSLLHNTRHTPIEFGKDVIARDSDGRLCAFQLKGNPRETMNLTQLRAIQPQLLELATFAVKYPGIEPTVPKPYLVMNGEIGEDATAALDALNAGALSANPITVWARGELLARAKALSVSLWPSETPDMSALFKVLIADPEAPLPWEEVEAICKSTLGLGPEKMKAKAPELKRRIASAGLLTGICVHRQMEKKNHWAVIQAWTMLSGLIAACAERYNLGAKGAVQDTFDLALELVDSSLAELATEIIERKHLAYPSLTDFAVYSARITILSGLMGAYWHRCKARKNEKGQEDAVTALDKLWVKRELWGEAAIPGELMRIWVLDHTELGPKAEALRVQLMDLLLLRNKNGSKNALPPPYYGFEETMRETTLSRKDAVFKGDKHDGWAHLAFPVFEELVRQNLKQQAKAAWPSLTRITHRRVDIPHAWQFPLSNTKEAENLTVTLPYPETWERVVKDAYADDPPPLPKLLADRPDVVGLIVLLHPHRASPAVARMLSKKLGRPWLS